MTGTCAGSAQTQKGTMLQNFIHTQPPCWVCT